MVPSVAIKAFTLALATIQPLSVPPRVAMARPASIASGIGTRPSVNIHPVSTPTIENIEPTERSNTPLTIRTTIPHAITPSRAIFRNNAVRLAQVGNERG